LGTVFPRLTSKRGPPYLCLLSTWDQRREPWRPANLQLFK
jgi:hypothetical protein